MTTQVEPPEKILSENLYSGLRTTLLYERNPFAVRVAWIHWDSGFRDSGLQIEDLIVAVNGIPLALPADTRERQNYTPKLIGQYGEYNGFAGGPLKDDSPITLTVLRRNRPGRGYKSLEVKGRLRAERIYNDAAGRRALAPGGPENLGRDGTDEAWLGWYGKRLWDWERLLDGRWMQGLNNRMERESHQQHKARVELALQKYPGEFSKRLKEDFDAVDRCLQGALSPLAPDALEFRAANERKEKDVAEAGEKAWKAFLEKKQGETLASIPDMDLIRGDRSAMTGKLVVLERLSWRQAVSDGTRSIFAGQHSGHWCFIPSDDPALAKFQKALASYQKKVAPKYLNDFDVVGRIGAQTRMVVTPRSGTIIGLNLEPVAIRLPGTLFVDLSGESFAGEESLKVSEVSPPPADASPSDVMRTLVAAVKAGAAEVWKSLYSDWTAVGGDGQPYYRPFNPYNTWDNDWNRARNVILNKVSHAEPIWESDPRDVMTGKEFEGAPRIEEATVEMNHINTFDDGDRVFVDINVRRVWTLQRRDGGPWRISSRNTL